jgi:hypothetical protein
MLKRCLQCPAGAAALARCRGLCRRCYQRCLLEVRRGQVSWVELERRGLAQPATPRGSGWRDFQVILRGQKRDGGQGD